MSKKSLDLRYAKNNRSNAAFFTGITDTKSRISNFKTEKTSATFTQDDENEISRDGSYAIMDELKSTLARNEQISIQAFRNALANQGVNDHAFQNKILCMILQNRIGIQYILGGAVTGLLIDNGFILQQSEDFQLSLEVNSENKVTLVFQRQWLVGEQPAISVDLSVSITPEKVEIKKFEVTQMSNEPSARDAYQFLKNNQQNILQKLISIIKQYFGSSNFRLEEDDKNQTTWSPSQNI